jgi:signal transduction histidine kinase
MVLTPLAIILPAGLLTYFGYKNVQGIDLRYKEQIDESVINIKRAYRNRARVNLNYTTLNQFKESFMRQVPELFAEPPESATLTFTLDQDLPFASRLFLTNQNGKLYSFERVQPSLPPPAEEPSLQEEAQSTEWRAIEGQSDSFHTRLRYEIQGKIVKDNFGFTDYYFLPYPADPYEVSVPRELAVFHFLIDSEPRETADWISAIGFTFDFEYLNTLFFQEVLNQMEDELDYPIAIFDKTTKKNVAPQSYPNEIGFPINTKYRQSIDDTIFPWYAIDYASSTGMDKLEKAHTEKIIHSSLIGATIIIMIMVVIGAQHNIFKELELSDMRSDFVARVSHELRTPLGLIRLYAETLEMGRTKSEDKKGEYLHAITKESERLSHLINNILDFSQIEANRKSYTFVPHSIEAILMDTLDSIEYHLERNGLTLHTEIEPNSPQLYCDPESIKQAIYNLLSNAMKYSGDGTDIWVRAYSHNQEFRIEIIDNGIGIDKDQLKKIFTKFYRVDDPRVRTTGGSGLGLSVVKHIVENHKGHVEVQSTLNKGTKFTMVLPLHPKTKTQSVS